MMASCQNSNDEIVTKPFSKDQEQIANKASGVWEKPSDNAYELDGYIHIIASTGETFYMGEKLDLKTSNSPEALKALEAVKTDSNINARLYGYVWCSASFNGMHVSLVSVSGGGQPTTYWTVYTFPSGNQQVFPDDGNVFGCGILHIQATING